MSVPSSGYLMGHTDHERRRLSLQAAVLNPLTEGFFVRAGLAPGMKVLDLGCGIGDVALIAGRLVGPEGHVTGIDMDEGALQIARARAAETQVIHISFEQAKVAEFYARRPYDAVVGRLLLVHMADPFAALRQAAAQIRAGGIVAFQESDFLSRFPNTAKKPLFDNLSRLTIDLFTRVPNADIGVRLFQMFHDAGLTNVQSRAEILLDGGPDCLYYEWFAETIRSLLPKLEATGIATAKELDVDTLSERLREEALTVGGYLASPIMVGTSGRRN